MPVKKDHLKLQPVGKPLPRKKRTMGGGGYRIPERNEMEFVKQTITNCEELVVNLKESKKKFSKYFDPKLIFKIELNQNVNEASFGTALSAAGITVIAQSPNNDGFWVVASSDEELKKLKERLTAHGDTNANKFLFAINGIVEIPKEDKIGLSLIKEPLQDGERAFINVEVWRMDKKETLDFLDDFRKFLQENNGELLDYLRTDNFTLVRVQVDKQLLDNMIQLREIARVDRPLRLKNDMINNLETGEIEEIESPPEGAPGILVIDSGVLRGHPLLGKAVKDEYIPSGLPDDGKFSPADVRAHGTCVAGIALYGDFDKCLEKEIFVPIVWLYSSRMMFLNQDGQTIYDEKKLLENQLVDTINWMLSNYPDCKVINISIGDLDKKMLEGVIQFNLACLLDELASQYDLIFVVSVGNSSDCASSEYPRYLIDSNDAKLVDPASSAIAISVGALAKKTVPGTLGFTVDVPSPITSVGPGYKKMIKPEVVEDGGGLDFDLDVITTNPHFVREGKLLTRVSGTSFSTPKVAHQIAQIQGKYSKNSCNMARAILISSCQIPKNQYDGIPDYDIQNSDEAVKLHCIYGYGKPNLDMSLFSNDNNVLLLEDATIGPDTVRFYSIMLPDRFSSEGEKEISVTLCYDPPVNKNKSEYLGVVLEFRMFKNVGVDDIVHQYADVEVEETDESEESYVPLNLRQYEIKLFPSSSIRKRGVNQRGSRVFQRFNSDDFDFSKPLILAVICKNKWVNPEHMQRYAICMRVIHSGQIDLYNQIELKNRERIRVRGELS